MKSTKHCKHEYKFVSRFYFHSELKNQEVTLNYIYECAKCGKRLIKNINQQSQLTQGKKLNE